VGNKLQNAGFLIDSRLPRAHGLHVCMTFQNKFAGHLCRVHDIHFSCATRVNLFKAVVRHILHTQRFHPYRLVDVQELSDSDKMFESFLHMFNGIKARILRP
jgi:hypothetical protein